MDSAIKDRRDSVYIEAQYHPLYKELTDGAEAPFEYMKDVFMTALLLGYRLGKPKPLEKRHMIFKISAFNPSVDLPILRAVALGPSGDISALTSENRTLTLAEEYANAGFAALRAEVLDRPGLTVNNLILLLQRLSEGEPSASEVATTADS